MQRKKTKKKKMAVYNLNAEQIRMIQKDAYNEAYKMIKKEHKAYVDMVINKKADELLDDNFHLFFYLPLLVLRDKLGYGKKRLKEFADLLTVYFEDWNSGLFTLEDIENQLKEETGLVINVKADKDSFYISTKEAS